MSEKCTPTEDWDDQETLERVVSALLAYEGKNAGLLAASLTIKAMTYEEFEATVSLPCAELERIVGIVNGVLAEHGKEIEILDTTASPAEILRSIGREDLAQLVMTVRTVMEAPE